MRTIRKRIKPNHRLKNIWALASKKPICETDSLEAEDQGDATAEAVFQQEQDLNLVKGHGGCGQPQPAWRKEGLKLYGVFKAAPGQNGEVSHSKDIPGTELIFRKVENRKSDSTLRVIF